mmetsp:Transcript_3479/g.6593  ORF Transcript_3479/g.6593 Transcript_3479/m.6593 type:complete len:82 (+) Transcript_3479:130-375(+)
MLNAAVYINDFSALNLYSICTTSIALFDQYVKKLKYTTYPLDPLSDCEIFMSKKFQICEHATAFAFFTTCAQAPNTDTYIT